MEDPHEFRLQAEGLRPRRGRDLVRDRLGDQAEHRLGPGLLQDRVPVRGGRQREAFFVQRRPEQAQEELFIPANHIASLHVCQENRPLDTPRR